MDWVSIDLGFREYDEDAIPELDWFGFFLLVMQKVEPCSDNRQGKKGLAVLVVSSSF